MNAATTNQKIRRVDVLALALVCSLALLSCHPDLYLPGEEEQSIGIVYPGEAIPRFAVKVPRGLSHLTEPLFDGNVVYLVMGTSHECAASQGTTERLKLFVLDTDRKSLVEVPGKNAPIVRRDSHLLTVNDGLLLFGGFRVKDEQRCESFFSSLLSFLSPDPVNAAMPPVYIPVSDSYRYSRSKGEWIEVPALRDAIPHAEREYVASTESSAQVYKVTDGAIIVPRANPIALRFIASETATLSVLPKPVFDGVENEALPPILGGGHLFLYFPNWTVDEESLKSLREERLRERAMREEFPSPEPADSNKLEREIQRHPGIFFNLRSRQWKGMSGKNAPLPEEGVSAAWSGARLVVWTPRAKSLGRIYDPENDRWHEIARVGAPVDREFKLYSAGDRLLLQKDAYDILTSKYSTRGAQASWLFDPKANSWRRSPTSSAEHAWFVRTIGEQILLHAEGQSMAWLNPEKDRSTDVKLDENFQYPSVAAAEKFALVFGYRGR